MESQCPKRTFAFVQKFRQAGSLVVSQVAIAVLTKVGVVVAASVLSVGNDTIAVFTTLAKVELLEVTGNLVKPISVIKLKGWSV